MNYRASYGENITGKSPLIRDRFATKGEKTTSNGGGRGGGNGGDDRSSSRGGGRYAIATVAKPLSVEGIERR
jgi:hypothetical protein